LALSSWAPALTGLISLSILASSPFRFARNEAAFCLSPDVGGFVLRDSATNVFASRQVRSNDARCRDVMIRLIRRFYPWALLELKLISISQLSNDSPQAMEPRMCGSGSSQWLKYLS
jgi:hypothetical protein